MLEVLRKAISYCITGAQSLVAMGACVYVLWWIACGVTQNTHFLFLYELVTTGESESGTLLGRVFWFFVCVAASPPLVLAHFSMSLLGDTVTQSAEATSTKTRRMHKQEKNSIGYSPSCDCVHGSLGSIVNLERMINAPSATRSQDSSLSGLSVLGRMSCGRESGACGLSCSTIKIRMPSSVMMPDAYEIVHELE